MTAAAQGPDNVRYIMAGPIPEFEGQPVEGHSWRVSGITPVTPDSIGTELPMVSVDDRVRMVGEFRVVSIRHSIDKKTGDLIREAILAPMSLSPCPWDPSDPGDDGVIRRVKA